MSPILFVSVQLICSNIDLDVCSYLFRRSQNEEVHEYELTFLKSNLLLYKLDPVY